MIENYLITKMMEGAFAWGTARESFYIKVGLGQTMTSQDILEGKIIVEIGLAIFGIEKFIILRLTQKMHES